MRDINPRSGKSAFDDKAWNSNKREQTIGFINRDAELSESIANPSLINPLGAVIPQAMNRLQPIVTPQEQRCYWNVDATGQASFSAPGIMVAEFVPVFGAASEYFRGGQRSIFIDKWTEFRQFYSGVEQFQPGDLQAVTAQIMHLKMQITHLWRTLRIMQTQNPNADSKYSLGDCLIKASGWNISSNTARKNYAKWHNTYNLIVSAFNKINWIKDLVPGNDRWAALCSEIYKDTSADTDYCQLMMLRPRVYYKLSTAADSEGIITWTMKADANYYQTVTTDEAVAVNMFEQYMDAIYQDVLNLYYDSSVQQITSTLVQVSKLMKEESLLTNLEMPYLDMNPDPISFTWDFPMMLAWHNMTLCDIDLEASTATVNGKEGVFTQTMYVNPGDDSIRTCCMARILNLPCFSPTNSDVANATQWMVITDKLHGEGRELDPSAYGTEIIARVSIFFWHNDANGRPVLGFSRFHQHVAILSGSAEPVDVSPVLQRFSVMQGSNFAYCPLIYQMKQDPDTNTIGYVEGVIGQLEVTYGVNYGVLSAIHDVWVSNFWGFPIHVQREGSVQLRSNDEH